MTAFAILTFLVVPAVFSMFLVRSIPAALAGGILLAMTGTVGQEEALDAVHWETLGLLAGMTGVRVTPRGPRHTGG